MILIDFLLKKSKIIIPVFLLLFLLQAIMGKIKWHYFPLYLWFFIYLILSLFYHYGNFTIKPNQAKWMIGLSLLLIFSTALFLHGFPTDKLPIPKGEYQVGTRVFELEDLDRKEIYSENKEAYRKIKYQIWYPSDNVKGFNRAKWISQGRLLTRQLAKSMFVPFFMLDQTASIDSNSYSQAPISDALESYPVVIISHGWKGFRELHTDVAEELASQGFIVASIDHTYGAQAVKFDNGHVAYLEKTALPSFVSAKEFNKASSTLAKTYGDDVALVIDDLEELNKVGQGLKGKFDLESLGLLGHSTGGGGDVYIAMKDERVKALMTMDAWLEPLQNEKLDRGLSIPSLLLRSEKWTGRPNDTYLNILIANSKDASLIQLNGTKHVDFAMTYMYSPLSKLVGFTGEFGGRDGAEAQRALIHSFFNQHLKDKSSTKIQSIEAIVETYDYMKIIK